MKQLPFLTLAGLLLLAAACDTAPTSPTPIAATVGATSVANVPTVAVADTPLPTTDTGTGEATGTPTAATIPATEAAAAPTTSSGSAATPVATQAAIDTMAADLEKELNAKITPTPDGSPDQHIEGVRVFRAQGGNSPLWVAYTYGARSFEPEEKHYVAIYAHPNEKWQELSKVEMDLPDYINPESVTQVQIDPTQLWVAVDGGAGAHAGAFYLLRFDGRTLRKEVEASSASPGAGEVRDVNGDGTPDVVLDESDPYVFCYACGVRLLNFGVMRWDGNQMVRVELLPLRDTSPTEANRLNQIAVREAKAELWKAAKEDIEKAKAIAPQDETLGWNVAIIGITADARQAHIKDSGHPLLATVFYGDYDAAIASIRQYSPEELFSPKSPIIVGTPAEGNEESLRKSIIDTTTKALEVDPNLAGAYFLRGWAEFEAGKDSAAATADVKRAAELNSQEEFFKNATAYMTNK